MASSNKLEIIIAAKDMASGALRQVAATTASLSRTVTGRTATMSTGLGSTLPSAIGRAGSALTSLKAIAVGALAGWGLKELGASFIEVGDSMDRLKISLDTVTGGEGERWFRELNEWAMRMPVNTQQAIESFTMMRAMGLQPTIADMTTLVDTTSALGGSADVMEGISRALGQIQTKGKASAEELMQLAERGVPAYQILQEQLGLSAEQVANIGNEAVNGTEAVQALLRGMAERFGGQAAKIQEKWGGMIESLKSYWMEFRRLVMDSGVMAFLEEALGRVIAKIEEMRESGDLERVARETGAAVIDTIAKVLRSLGDVMMAFYAIKSAVHTVAAAIAATTAAAIDLAAAMAATANPYWAIKVAAKGFRETFPQLATARDMVDEFGVSQMQAAMGADAAGARAGARNVQIDRWVDEALAAAERLNTAVAGSITGSSGVAATAARETSRAAEETAESIIQAAKKVAEADLQMLQKRLGEYQSFQAQVRAEIERTADLERRHAQELTDIYRQQADVRRSTADLVAGLRGETMEPLERYKAQRSELNRMYVNLLQESSGQDLVKGLEDYQRQVADLAREFRDGVESAIGPTVMQTISGREVINAAISDIERAGQAQQRVLEDLAAEKSRQVQQDREWGESLRQTAQNAASEIQWLQSVVADLSSQISAADRIIEIGADDRATPVVDQIRAAIDALHDKTVTITTVHREVFVAAGGDVEISGSFASGTMRVPATAIYQLHEGEIVVARRAAEAVRENPVLRAIVAGDVSPADAVRRMVLEQSVDRIVQGPGVLVERDSRSDATETIIERAAAQARTALSSAPPPVPHPPMVPQPAGVSAGPSLISPVVVSAAARLATTSDRAMPATPAGRQVTVMGGIHIHVQASAAPKAEQDWRRIVRSYIIPELRAVGR